MKVAIQGEVGSFHDEAAKIFFTSSNYEILACSSFEKVFFNVASQQADFGIVAIENSLYGSIHETYDQLISSSLEIIGEIEIQVRQQLIGTVNTKLSDIKTVISHPAALDQCKNYLSKHLPNAELVEHADTAGAVRELSISKDEQVAVIASDNACKLYGMNLLAKNIEDEQNNITRFIVISQKNNSLVQQNNKPNKASLILTTDHTPGSLFNALRVFNDLRLNMTKIESRQVRGQPYKYQFIIDIISNSADLSLAVSKLESQNCQVITLGHYKSSQDNK